MRKIYASVLSGILYQEIYKTMMAYFKLFWIFIKAQFCRIFLKYFRLQVQYVTIRGYLAGNYYLCKVLITY